MDSLPGDAAPALRRSVSAASAPARETPPTAPGAPAVPATHAPASTPLRDDLFSPQARQAAPVSPVATARVDPFATHQQNRVETPSSGSPRTPSPILGGTRDFPEDAAPAAQDSANGHLTFPSVAPGVGSMEQEMQLLMGLESADDLDDDAEREAAAFSVRASLDRLSALGFSEGVDARGDAFLDPSEPVDCQLARMDAAYAHVKHLLRVTRLASLSLFSSLRISYAHMLHAERDIKARLEVELSGSKSQSKMLSDMVARASLNAHDGAAYEGGSAAHDTSAGPDTVGESATPQRTPVVQERNRLLADKRYLRQRVRDAEAQVARLETELKAMRPLLLRTGHDMDVEAETATPRLGHHAEVPTPRQPHAARTHARRRREAVMGDAKSEHLILAARMLRTLRHASRGGGDIASPGSSLYTDQSPSKYKTDVYMHGGDMDMAPSTPQRHGRMREPQYPTTPQGVSVSTPSRRTARTDEGSVRTHHRSQSLRGPPSAAADAPTDRSAFHAGAAAPPNGIDELLQAAQSLRGTDKARAPQEPPADATGGAANPAFGSPKRRRVSPAPGDRTQRAQLPPLSTHGTAQARSAGASALDLLADQAAASEVSHSPPKTPNGTPDTRAAQWAALSKSAPAKAKAGGTSISPEKRLPYVRWSAEEDTKLRRAIKEHGQRWEHVARAVGTRSYHQCRQRYLLMRRKEAAANGLSSPSKPTTPSRMPLRTPSRTQDEHMPGAMMPMARRDDDEMPSSASSYDDDAPHRPLSDDAVTPRGAPSPMYPGMPAYARFDPIISPSRSMPTDIGMQPRDFVHARSGPTLYG
ncbi:hypothetical protein MSPP1_003361 [Malassezia sp. CBS 17886]|nr:hypothetical protein MSPP1_003361 [Malassezia sp. CBS 17886]